MYFISNRDPELIDFSFPDGGKKNLLSNSNHHLQTHNLPERNVYKELISDQQILQACYRHEY